MTTLASLVTTDLFIVGEDEPINEDVYVTSMSGKVEGIIDGDLVIFTGDLSISGTITGSVIVFSSGTVAVEPTGRVEGSLRGAAVSVTIQGEVDGDVFVSAPSVVVEDTATIGRDAMVFAGTGRIEGTVERDVRGRTLRLVVDGSVAGDLDVATQKLEIGPAAEIDGDVLYRSPVEADIASQATIGGTLTRLSAQSNFVYGVILALANIVGFLGFLVVGLVVLAVLRGSSTRAAAAVVTRPIRSLLVGVVTVLLLPAGIAVLAVTLVGIPLAALLALVGIALFIVGPVPAVTALGNRILFKRGGLFGAFLVGAILWRLGIWLIPIVGGFVYLVGFVWGVGAWVLGALATRRADPIPVALLPDNLVAAPEVPIDWEPPLLPVSPSVVASEVEDPTVPEPGDASDMSAPSSSDFAQADDEAGSEDQREPETGNDHITFSGIPASKESAEPRAEFEVEEPAERTTPEPPPDGDGSTPPSDSWGLPGT